MQSPASSSPQRIFERSGRVPKTHRGVHAQFARLVKDKSPFAELTRFLSRAYDYKAVADYEIGPEAILPLAEALAAIDAAAKFIDGIAELLAER